MKVAVATDDGREVAGDFGFAKQFVVLTVTGGKVADRELRPKPVDARPPAEKAERDPNDHFAGHRVGKGPRSHYDEMAAQIGDCDAVLAGEFSTGARSALRGYGIEPVRTGAREVDDAAVRYAGAVE
ncbi:MAG TPA: NifB/NifX family molybdenum-iron cluster-binding protein [Chloroflexota bacterium]